MHLDYYSMYHVIQQAYNLSVIHFPEFQDNAPLFVCPFPTAVPQTQKNLWQNTIGQL